MIHTQKYILKYALHHFILNSRLFSLSSLHYAIRGLSCFCTECKKMKAERRVRECFSSQMSHKNC